MREGVIRFCIVKREYDTMDNETKENLTELRHQQELLKERMEGNMKAMKAENNEALIKNESSIDRLQSSNEKAIGELQLSNEKNIGELQLSNEKNVGELRTDFEKLRTDIGRGINKLLIVLIAICGVGVAIMGLLVQGR